MPPWVVLQLFPLLVLNTRPSNSIGKVQEGVYPEEARSDRLKMRSSLVLSEKLRTSFSVSRRKPPSAVSAKTNSEPVPTDFGLNRLRYFSFPTSRAYQQIGRASCRGRV